MFKSQQLYGDDNYMYDNEDRQFGKHKKSESYEDYEANFDMNENFIKNHNVDYDKTLDLNNIEDKVATKNSSCSTNNSSLTINNNISLDKDKLVKDVVKEFEGVVEKFRPVRGKAVIADLGIEDVKQGEKVLLFATINWFSDSQGIANPKFKIIRNNEYGKPLYDIRDTGDDVYEQSPTTTSFQFLDEKPPLGDVIYKLAIETTGETIFPAERAVFTALKVK